MAVTDSGRLRALLGEVVPSGGSEADTLFTDEQIDDFLASYPTLEAAAAEGWKQKAAILSDLVDTVESGAQRKMSDLHKHAMEMLKFYTSGDTAVVVEPPTSIGRAKSHRIKRRDYSE